MRRPERSCSGELGVPGARRLQQTNQQPGGERGSGGGSGQLHHDHQDAAAASEVERQRKEAEREREIVRLTVVT